jgi:hypothetical protein
MDIAAYTAGLTDAGLPELIMVGLDAKIMQDVLNEAARRHIADEIKPGDQLEGLASVTFRVVEIPDTYAAVMARRLCAGEVRLLQLVWPDQFGHYPGEPGWTLGNYQEIPPREAIANPSNLN